MLSLTPEKYIIVRNSDEDAPFVTYPDVPRVSFIPPDQSGTLIEAKLLSIDRSLHLILIPEDCPDPGHPHRKIRDSGYPSIDLQNLLHQLKS